MRLEATAEYIPDGDVLVVTAYVLDGTTAKPGTVASGVCALRQGTTTVQSATYDRYYGNSDGAFKFAFNHPTVTTGQVYVTATLLDGTNLDSLAPVQILPMPDTTTAAFTDL